MILKKNTREERESPPFDSDWWHCSILLLFLVPLIPMEKFVSVSLSFSCLILFWLNIETSSFSCLPPPLLPLDYPADLSLRSSFSWRHFLLISSLFLSFFFFFFYAWFLPSFSLFSNFLLSFLYFFLTLLLSLWSLLLPAKYMHSFVSDVSCDWTILAFGFYAILFLVTTELMM